MKAISYAGCLRGEHLKRLWAAGVLPVRANLVRWRLRAGSSGGAVLRIDSGAVGVDVLAKCSVLGSGGLRSSVFLPLSICVPGQAILGVS